MPQLEVFVETVRVKVTFGDEAGNRRPTAETAATEPRRESMVSDADRIAMLKAENARLKQFAMQGHGFRE